MLSEPRSLKRLKLKVEEFETPKFQRVQLVHFLLLVTTTLSVVERVLNRHYCSPAHFFQLQPKPFSLGRLLLVGIALPCSLCTSIVRTAYYLFKPSSIISSIAISVIAPSVIS